MASNKISPNKHNLVQDTKLTSGKKLFLDGGGDTFIDEYAADSVRIKVGNNIMLTLVENGVSGSTAYFKTCCAVFTKVDETFSDDSLLTTGGTHDTHFDFRHTNKISCSVSNSFTNANLIFPSAVAGNFLLVLSYGGDYDITNWKVYEGDLSEAGNADVFWPGGLKPNTTSSGVDIFSFFWDGDRQACYGVASLAFAEP